MVTIDKVYYSQATEDINIIVKDNTFGIEWFEDSMSSIKLSTELDEKLIEFGSTNFSYTIVDYNTAMIVIKQDKISNESGTSFSINGIILVSIEYGENKSIDSFFYNPEEFYMYKLKLAGDISDSSYNKTIERDIMLMSYLERAIKDAMDIKEKNDAIIFYNKAKRIFLAHKTIHYKNERFT